MNGTRRKLSGNSNALLPIRGTGELLRCTWEGSPSVEPVVPHRCRFVVQILLRRNQAVTIVRIVNPGRQYHSSACP